MIVNDRQDDWDLHLPHVDFAYINSVSAAPGLAPNDVYMGGLPRLPLPLFERIGVMGHQSPESVPQPPGLLHLVIDR